MDDLEVISFHPLYKSSHHSRVYLFPNTTSMASYAVKVFGPEHVYPGTSFEQPFIVTEDLSDEDLQAGIALIAEQAAKDGQPEPRFNGLLKEDFV